MGRSGNNTRPRSCFLARHGLRFDVEGWASTTTTHSQSTPIPLIWLRSQWSPRFRPNAMHRQYEVVQHAEPRCSANGFLSFPIWLPERVHVVGKKMRLVCFPVNNRCSI
jgi:hypothetical protein